MIGMIVSSGPAWRFPADPDGGVALTADGRPPAEVEARDGEQRSGDGQHRAQHRDGRTKCRGRSPATSCHTWPRAEKVCRAASASRNPTKARTATVRRSSGFTGHPAG